MVVALFKTAGNGVLVESSATKRASERTPFSPFAGGFFLLLFFPL